MMEIRGKIIGFKSDGTMVIFESKEELLREMKNNPDIEYVVASPKFLFDIIKNEMEVEQNGIYNR